MGKGASCANRSSLKLQQADTSYDQVARPASLQLDPEFAQQLEHHMQESARKFQAIHQEHQKFIEANKQSVCKDFRKIIMRSLYHQLLDENDGLAIHHLSASLFQHALQYGLDDDWLVSNQKVHAYCNKMVKYGFLDKYQEKHHAKNITGPGIIYKDRKRVCYKMTAKGMEFFEQNLQADL